MFSLTHQLILGFFRDDYLKLSDEPNSFIRDFLDQDKDYGLDVVSWHDLDGKRGCYLHFVGQCATGANWEAKTTEIQISQLNEHIKWAVPPVRFFAVPFMILDKEKFRRMSAEGGLFLDRVRISLIAEKSKVSQALINKIEAYCDSLYL